MDSLVLKKAIFNPTEIILIKKKGNIIISVDDIEIIIYHKPSIGTLLATLIGAFTSDNMFEIVLKTKINGRKEYCLFLQYKEVLKLQTFFQQKISIY